MINYLDRIRVFSTKCFPSTVRLYEVGPREAFQSCTQHVPLRAKREFVEALVAAGLMTVEVTSFVSPKQAPQMADAAELLLSINQRFGVRYPVMVPNLRGLERALAAGAEAIVVFMSLSEQSSRISQNCTVGEAFERLCPVIAEAKRHQLWTRAFLSSAWGSRYDGPVNRHLVCRVAHDFIELNVDEISLGDTSGVATPDRVEDLLGSVCGCVPIEQIALHLHDYRGMAMANAIAGLLCGVTSFDTAAGGFGGAASSPSAEPEGGGQLPTEDILYLLNGLGITTGVDIESVRAATIMLHRELSWSPPGRYWVHGPAVASVSAAARQFQ